MNPGHPPEIPPETPEERSLAARRAGFRLTPEEAADLVNRYEAWSDVRETLHSIDVSGHEPSGVFVCRRRESGPDKEG